MHISHLVNFVPSCQWAVVLPDKSMVMVGPAGRAPGTIWSNEPHTTVACTCEVADSPTTLLYTDAEGFSRVVAQLWCTGSTLTNTLKLNCRVVGGVIFEADAMVADLGRVWLDFYPDRVDVRCSNAGSLGLVHATLMSLAWQAADVQLGLAMGSMYAPQLKRLTTAAAAGRPMPM